MSNFCGYGKAFNSLNHRLILDKLKAYGIQPAALKLIQNYLTESYQKVNIVCSSLV